MVSIKVELLLTQLQTINVSLSIQLYNNFWFLTQRFELSVFTFFNVYPKNIFWLHLSENSLVHSKSFIFKFWAINIEGYKLIVLKNVVIKVRVTQFI